uniref:Uncharacterized protein n=1 Tax=Aegilops tauschii TaxID=37682 RepID=M8C5V2_AEGTA
MAEETKPKKQKDEERIINGLPGELIERIFLKLPVSTLLRCTGVCKEWHKIIRDPQFVTSHLQDAPQCAFLFFPQESISGKLYPADAILIDETWSQSACAVPVVGPGDSLCGSCNGLLCLYTKSSTLKIANLATGECLHLDKPVKNLRGDYFLYNFGFHPVTKEYKIIHFLGDSVEGHPLHNNSRFRVVQVYTLGDDKWRDIKTPEALSLNCVKNSGAVNIGGTMYWLTEDMVATWQHAVMTFDLSEENFARIQLPATVLEDSAAQKALLMAKLLDFRPHKPDNMQSYICMKSLIRLDVYKKAGIVRRPKQRGVWELKKWEAWEHKPSENERIWTDTHRDEHEGAAHAQCYRTMINGVLPRILNDTIQLEIGMKINQIFPNIPDQVKVYICSNLFMFSLSAIAH